MDTNHLRVNISDADFKELERIVDSEDGTGTWAIAETADDRCRMRSLAQLGFVELVEIPLADTRCRSTLAGRDFVSEVRDSIERADAEKRDQRRHDFRVAAFGAVTGGVLGLFSGCLGSWLVTQAIPAIAQALSR